MTVLREVAPGVHALTLGRGAAASNVYVVCSGADWVLVDAGWPTSAAGIRAAVRRVVGERSPAGILLTHVHPDHSGAAGDLARAWDVPVFLHPGEVPMAAGRHVPEFTMPLDRWMVVPLMRLLPARTRERVEAAGDITDVVRPLAAGGVVPVLPGWTWVATPGHTPGHVAYVRSADAVAITGDALLTVDLNSWRGLLAQRACVAEPPRYTTWDRARALRSLGVLAELKPALVLPGHGAPLADDAAGALRSLADRRRLWGGLQPQYTGREAYRPPPRWYVRLQPIGFAATALGLSPRDVAVLEVPGRRSGRVRRTTVVVVEHRRARYVVALAGESEWVRNVRASGGRALLRRRERRAVTLAEVPAAERAPVLRAYLLRGGRRAGTPPVTRDAQNIFGVADADETELATVAPRYPVFRVMAGWSRPGVQGLGGRTE